MILLEKNAVMPFARQVKSALTNNAGNYANQFSIAQKTKLAMTKDAADQVMESAKQIQIAKHLPNHVYLMRDNAGEAAVNTPWQKMANSAM